MTATTEPLAIHDAIHHRRSAIAFAPRGIEPEKLAALFEAARWAPSSRNGQPWHFVVATREDATGFARVLDTLDPSNARWARQAGALVVTVARTRWERDGKPNLHALHDLGLASQNLMLEAVGLGLKTHPMGGFDAARARESLGIPEGHDPVAVIAVGYAGDGAGLPAELLERAGRARTRRALDETVFQARWGEAASWAGTGAAPAVRRPGVERP